MRRILFQGDSITDCGRSRTETRPNVGLGSGYPNLLAGRLLCDSDAYEIRNRAVSGDRIGDTYARWIEDTLNLPFDILSILHGINDVGFSLRLGMGSDRERFAFIYDRMLSEVRATHPEARLVLLEPFLLPVDEGPDTQYHNDIYTGFERWYGEIQARGKIAEELAEKYDAIFVPLADAFLSGANRLGAAHYSLDCIHPTPAGHELIARRWMDACGSIL